MTTEAITEKIVVQIIPKLMSTVPMWTSRSEIQSFVRTAVNQLIDVAGLDDMSQKQVREPQSEREDVKEKHDFVKELVKQAEMFVNALQNFEIVQEHDLSELRAERAYQLNAIERLVKFKSKCEEPLKEVVNVLSSQIADLEKQLDDNQKLADLILIEIKAIFVSAIAKLQTLPQNAQIVADKKIVVLVKQEKTREVLADTQNEGTGDSYAQPAKPSFDNPIVAIHHVNASMSCFKFETKDGVIGTHPASKHEFLRLAINPPDAAITLIRVWIY